MKAEELVALAAAHGIDLVEAARLTGQAPARATVRMRNQAGRAYDVLKPPSGLEVRGSSSPSYERPSYSVAELGQAAQGVPQVAFMAACYAYAGDRTVYWKLWDALNWTAHRLRVRNNWPAQVRGTAGLPHFYLEPLAQLVLDEDAHQHLFQAAPALYWICLQVDENTWRRAVFERFDQVKLRYLGWIDEAMRTMQPRLEELAEA